MCKRERFTQGQFLKEADEEVDNAGIPYDYGSIMHYRSKVLCVLLRYKNNRDQLRHLHAMTICSRLRRMWLTISALLVSAIS